MFVFNISGLKYCCCRVLFDEWLFGFCGWQRQSVRITIIGQAALKYVTSQDIRLITLVFIYRFLSDHHQFNVPLSPIFTIMVTTQYTHETSDTTCGLCCVLNS